MIWLSKKYKRWYTVLSLTGALAIMTVCALQDKSIVLYTLFALLWIVAMAIVFTRSATRELNGLNAYIMEDCEPEKAVAAYEEILFRKLPDLPKLYVLLNLSTAYMTAGDFAKGKQALDTAQPLLQKAKKNSYEFFYYNNLAFYYFCVNDLDSAQRALDDMKCALENTQKPRPDYVRLHREKQFVLQVLRGNFQGAQEVFQSSFDNATAELARVTFQYYLALVYLGQGQEKAAEKSLQYVVANGKQTIYAKWSEKFLKRQSES